MQYIIIVDHRDNNGGVSIIEEEDEFENTNIKIYDDLDEAKETTKTQFLCKSFPSYILNLDTGEIEDC